MQQLKVSRIKATGGQLSVLFAEINLVRVDDRFWPEAECSLSNWHELSQRISRAIVIAHVLPGNARGSAITRVTQLLWTQRLRTFLGCNPGSRDSPSPQLTRSGNPCELKTVS